MDSLHNPWGLVAIISICIFAMMLRCALIWWQVKRPMNRYAARERQTFYPLGPRMELCSYPIQPHLYLTRAERYAPYPRPSPSRGIGRAQPVQECEEPLLHDEGTGKKDKSAILDVYEPPLHEKGKLLYTNYGEPVERAEETGEGDPPTIEATQFF